MNKIKFKKNNNCNINDKSAKINKGGQRIRIL